MDRHLNVSRLVKNPHSQEGVEIYVPGTWWVNGPANEQDMTFLCTVLKYDDKYDWPTGSSTTRKPGAYIISVNDAEEDPYPMDDVDFGICYYQTKDKEALEAEHANPSSAAAPVAQGATPESESSGKASSSLWDYCIALTTEEKACLYGKDLGKTHRCLISGCKLLLTQHGKSTSGLLNHFSNKHKSVYDAILADSKHSSIRISKGGVTFKVFDFDSALPNHIRFVIWCARNKRPFSIGTDEAFRDFCQGLNIRYVPPSRDTCIAILQCICDLMGKAILERLQRVKSQVGSPYASVQMDMWSTQNANESFGCVIASVIEERVWAGEGGVATIELVPTQFCIDFSAFPDIEHSGKNISRTGSM
jgi:hypothetical protein